MRSKPLGSIHELVRTYGARGLARRALHETLLRTGAYRLGRHRRADPIWRVLPIDVPALRTWYAANPAAARAVVAEADAMLGGTYRYFGAIDVPIGWPPAWLHHPKTDVTWDANEHWTKSRDSSAARGDIKWIWEPARFGFAWLLARALVASGDLRYARELVSAVRSWLETDPPYNGPGWSCGQETAIRALGLVFAISVLAATGQVAERAMFDALLHACAQRIAVSIHHALSQRNNHAISEAAALWTLATLAPSATAESRRWLRIGTAALEEAIADQFADDGAYIQESINYHRFALQLLLWVRWVARTRAVTEPHGVSAALARSLALLSGLVPAEGGRLPNYGHNDGAVLFRLDTCAHEDVRATLQAIALDQVHGARFAPGPWDELAVWLGYELAAPAPAQPEGLRTTRSGYVTARVASWFAFTRVPCFEHHRPGQADALHLDAWLAGRNIALDPGTFAYSEAPPWDNRLAETRVHNTCSVGEASQMRRRGRFLWTHWTCAELVAHEATADRVVVLSRTRAAWDTDHVHSRLVVVERDGIDVLDAVIGSTEAVLRLHWNLDGVAWTRREATWTDAGVAIEISAATDAVIRDVRGDPTSQLGWSSRSYGLRVPCTAIDVEVRARETWFHTQLHSAPHAIAPRIVETWTAGDHLAAYAHAIAR